MARSPIFQQLTQHCHTAEVVVSHRNALEKWWEYNGASSWHCWTQGKSPLNRYWFSTGVWVMASSWHCWTQGKSPPNRYWFSAKILVMTGLSINVGLSQVSFSCDKINDVIQTIESCLGVCRCLLLFVVLLLLQNNPLPVSSSRLFFFTFTIPHFWWGMLWFWSYILGGRYPTCCVFSGVKLKTWTIYLQLFCIVIYTLIMDYRCTLTLNFFFCMTADQISWCLSILLKFL